MKNMLLVITLGLLIVSQAEAARGRKPCSGAKGGISHCTSSGKFVCNDGSLSRSQKICSGYGGGDDTVEQHPVKKSPAKKKATKTRKPEPSHLAEMNEDSPAPVQQKKPTCAPLYMANKPGYTRLPICADNQY
ncbi:MAG TPA: hypothetical protein DD781_15480 [Leclercia adecarboxylata]|nr:hypothetical protein [Leclercia adecarboxylata]